MLAITGMFLISMHWHSLCWILSNSLNDMAAKKTANKTTASAPNGKETKKQAAPAAKKATKKTVTVNADSPSASAESAQAPVPVKAAAPIKNSTPKKVSPASPDAIAQAAYFNYRRRVEQGLPGDSHGDWLEAERYLSQVGNS
jgi:hypothetical protein